MRSLGKTLIKSLNEGELSPVLNLVKNDEELFLGIRERNAIVYYMGGKIMDITFPRGRSVKITIDKKYFEDGIGPGFITRNHPREWCENIASLKDTIKRFQLKKTSIKIDKIIQQIILTGNNSSPNKEYFIVDMEYSMPGIAYGRFDFIGLRKNENSKKYQIVLIELKQGSGAFGTSCKSNSDNSKMNPYGSGVVGHAWNFSKFLENKEKIKGNTPASYLQKDIVNIICDYRMLGLLDSDVIPDINPEDGIGYIDGDTGQIEIIFICANANESARESISKYLGTHPVKEKNAKYNVKHATDINEELCGSMKFLFQRISYDDDCIPKCDWFRSVNMETINTN
jgi:hypothetical protein